MRSPMRHKGSALKAEDTATRAPYAAAGADAVAVALTGAVLAVRAAEPVVAVVPAERAGDESLPCGAFLPGEHGTLEGGVRILGAAQTGVELGFLEQLCTLGAPSRHRDRRRRTLVSVSYLALVGPRQCSDRTRADLAQLVQLLPLGGLAQRPAGLPDRASSRGSKAWAAEPEPSVTRARWMPDRRQRLRIAFGSDGAGWDEEKVLERYELLQRGGHRRRASGGGRDRHDAAPAEARAPAAVGDQSLVLARAIGELRRAIKCRPIVFELMPEVFTLFELQKTVEAILGPHLHKQNFRRLVEGCGLVEPTGDCGCAPAAGRRSSTASAATSSTSTPLPASG